MGKNTTYAAKVGLAEILELAMVTPAARVSAKRDFLGKLPLDAQAVTKLEANVAPR